MNNGLNLNCGEKMEKQVKILVVDDHQIFLEGLTLILKTFESGIEVVSENSVSSCLQNLKSLLEYSLVLVDLNMPSPDGFALLDAVRIQNLDVPIAVISGSENFADVQRAISKGAAGFIFKSESSEEMFKAISILLQGGVYVPDKFQDQIDFLVAEDNTLSTSLTHRQYQVLKMINDGLTNSEIASVLSVSVSAVKGHIEKIFKTFGVNNRTACLRAAREQGVEL